MGAGNNSDFVSDQQLVDIIRSESVRLFDLIGIPREKWREHNLGHAVGHSQRLAEGTWNIVIESDGARGHFDIEAPREWLSTDMFVRRLPGHKTSIVFLGVPLDMYRDNMPGFVEAVKEELKRHKDSRGIL